MAGLAAAALLVGFLVIGSGGDRAATPAAHATRTRTQAPTPTSPPSHASHPGGTTTPTHAPQPLTRAQALQRLRQTILRSTTSGQLDEASARDLEHRVDDLVKHLDEGKPEDFDHKLEDFSHRLDDLAKDGKVSASTELRLRRALRRV